MLIVYTCWGLFLAIFGRYFGSALYEANKRQLSWLWRNVFKKKQEDIDKLFNGFPLPYGYTYAVVITHVVGILLTVMFLFLLLSNIGIF